MPRVTDRGTRASSHARKAQPRSLLALVGSADDLVATLRVDHCPRRGATFPRPLGSLPRVAHAART